MSQLQMVASFKKRCLKSCISKNPKGKSSTDDVLLLSGFLNVFFFEFHGKLWESVGNRLHLTLLKSDDTEDV